MYTTQLTNSCRHLRALTALSYKYSPILASQTNRCLSGRAHLRSAERHDISVPSTRTQLGRQSFHVAAPAVWNVLPSQLRSSSISRGQFKAGLKTHLFTQAYTDSSENFSLTVYCFTLYLHYRVVSVAVAVPLASWGTTAATRIPRLRIGERPREWTRG